MSKVRRLTKEEKRKIFKLYRDGTTHREIAKELECSVDTVKYTVNARLKKVSEGERNRIVASHNRMVRCKHSSDGIEEVPPYRCPKCHKLVTLRPCVICAAREASKSEDVPRVTRRCLEPGLDYDFSEAPEGSEERRQEAVNFVHSHQGVLGCKMA